jgi:catechol 2,3-dioxygenase
MNGTETTPVLGALGTHPTASRLPEATRVGGVVLQVSNLEESLAFYTQILGLRELSTSHDQASLGVPDSVISLVTLRAKPGTRRARRRGAFGLFHFAVLMPDRSALGRFVVHLAERGVQAGMSDHLVSEAIYLSDPDGLGIEVYADRPRSTWSYVHGQLAMSTDPLDVNDLVRTAGARRWDGAPAGTTMGHMHLHVGSLEEAAHFYQQLLGFDITVSGYPGALFFSAGGYHHHLGTNTWAPGPAAPADQARMLEWTLVVPTAADVAAIGDRLSTAGARVESGGDSRVVSDPWGTQVRITAEL